MCWQLLLVIKALGVTASGVPGETLAESVGLLAKTQETEIVSDVVYVIPSASNLTLEDSIDKDVEVAAADDGGSASGGIMLACIGGALSATGANVLAWSVDKARLGADWARRYASLFYLACFVLNLSGIALYAYSTASGGAVATVMPFQTGANLLTNMFWQMVTGMKRFNKSMRIGTLILLCAVAELAHVGPSEPDDLDFIKLIEQPVAQLWIAFLVVCIVLSLIACWFTASRGRESASKLAAFVSVVSFTTVLGSSISKCFGLLTGPSLYVAGVLYFIDGSLVMIFTMLGNAKCDVSVYIPMQLSSQLVINMLTGIFVWGDAKYIDSWTTYILVYIICVMGVYLISPQMDAVGDLVHLLNMRRSKLSELRASYPFGDSMLVLLQVWREQAGQRQVQDVTSVAACEEALRELLHEGQESGAITIEEMARLIMLLVKESGVGPTAAVVHWIENDLSHFKTYARIDPAFQNAFRETLSHAESERLLALETALEKASAFSEGSIATSTGVSLPNAASGEQVARSSSSFELGSS